MVFLKELFEKVDFEKNGKRQKHEKFPRGGGGGGGGGGGEELIPLDICVSHFKET